MTTADAVSTAPGAAASAGLSGTVARTAGQALPPPRLSEHEGTGVLAGTVLPDGLVLAGPVHERGCLVFFTRGFPGEAAQVARVRAALTLLLDACPASSDAVLIASELAANAVVHTRSAAPGGQFTVAAGACPGRHVWVAVQDEGGPWAGRDDDGRPHGLELTAALARDWGVGGHADRGRTVWAVLAWAGDAGTPARAMKAGCCYAGTCHTVPACRLGRYKRGTANYLPATALGYWCRSCFRWSRRRAPAPPGSLSSGRGGPYISPPGSPGAVPMDRRSASLCP